jgi:hypothetical protein
VEGIGEKGSRGNGFSEPETSILSAVDEAAESSTAIRKEKHKKCVELLKNNNKIR